MDVKVTKRLFLSKIIFINTQRSFFTFELFLPCRLSQIRQTVQSLVKQLENEKNRIAKMKEKKRRKLIKVERLLITIIF